MSTSIPSIRWKVKQYDYSKLIFGFHNIDVLLASIQASLWMRENTTFELIKKCEDNEILPGSEKRWNFAVS